MQWNHLPVAGGIYDQHPDILQKFQYIFERQGREEERKQREDKMKQQRGMGQGPRGLGSARGR